MIVMRGFGALGSMASVPGAVPGGDGRRMTGIFLERRGLGSFIGGLSRLVPGGTESGSPLCQRLKSSRGGIIRTLGLPGKERCPSSDPAEAIRYSTVLSPVLLITTELALEDEKLDPLDLLPLEELEAELELVRIVSPVL